MPLGSCYLAEDPLAALLEVARGLTILSEDFLNTRRLLTTTVPTPLRVGDLTAAAAYGFGVTGAISATPDYSVSQAWAWTLRAAGFDGVRYHVSHDPRSDLTGIALFGSAGTASRPPQSSSQGLPAGLLLDAAPFGIRVASNLPAVPGATSPTQ